LLNRYKRIIRVEQLHFNKHNYTTGFQYILTLHAECKYVQSGEAFSRCIIKQLLYYILIIVTCKVFGEDENIVMLY